MLLALLWWSFCIREKSDQDDCSRIVELCYGDSCSGSLATSSCDSDRWLQLGFLADKEPVATVKDLSAETVDDHH